MRKVSVLPVVALLAAVFMALPQTDSGRKVEVRGFAFRPATVKIPVGGTIRIHNASRTTHTATCEGCGRDTGDIRPGLARPLEFRKAGTYIVFCRYHRDRGMAMRVRVGAGGEAPPATPSQ